MGKAISAKTTVFDKAGKALEVTRLNAVDMVRGGEFFWQKPATSTAIPEAAPAPAPVAAAEEAPAEEAPEAPAAVDLDELALAVTGGTAEEFLNTFSEDGVKEFASEKYGIKSRSNTRKDKVIAQIIEAETERLTADDE